MRKVFDKFGNEIKEFNVLKVFHFVGARRKKHYMYKWVRTYGGELYAKHLDAETDGKFGGYMLWCQAEAFNSEGRLMDTEIVQ